MGKALSGELFYPCDRSCFVSFFCVISHTCFWIIYTKVGELDMFFCVKLRLIRQKSTKYEENRQANDVPEIVLECIYEYSGS